MSNINRFLVLFLMITLGCSENKKDLEIINPETYWGENPWPEIRKQRINKLLPTALAAANVDCWLVICRENNNDPIADHIGGENAGGTAVFLFYNDDNGFHSRVFSPSGEATALDDLDIHDEVVSVKRGTSAIKMASEFIKEQDFKTIAVNSSDTNSMADGLSFSQRMDLETQLGELAQRLVPSTALVYEWLSIKLPEEVEILRKAAQLTADWQIEAYKQVQPGKSTDADIAKFLKQKMAEYGVTDGWAPDQNRNVNSGADRGHSHATDKIIMPGDVRPASEKLLKAGMTFAFDGFHSWKLKDGSLKTISVEEMAVVNSDGAEYLIAPQEDLILISSD